MTDLLLEIKEHGENRYNYYINDEKTTVDVAYRLFDKAHIAGVTGDISYNGITFVVMEINYGYRYKSMKAREKVTFLESIKINK